MSEDVWPLDEEVEPKSLDELLDLLMRRTTNSMVYRGQRKYDWPLVCTLSRVLREQALVGGPIDHDLMESMVVDESFRRYVERVETTLLRDFIEQAKGLAITDLPVATDRLAWWELMQHHGAPTRLLDWTKSPFIALWFAFWLHEDGHGDVALWVFDQRNSWLSYPKAVGGVSEPGWEKFLDDRQWQNHLAEEAIASREMVPLVISPRVVLPRVVAQQSVLTLVPNIDAPTYLNHFVLKKLSTKIRVRSSWKPDILDFCERLNITRSALVRDLDSIGDSLWRRLTTTLALTAAESAVLDYRRAVQTSQGAQGGSGAEGPEVVS